MPHREDSAVPAGVRAGWYEAALGEAGFPGGAAVPGAGPCRALLGGVRHGRIGPDAHAECDGARGDLPGAAGPAEMGAEIAAALAGPDPLPAILEGCAEALARGLDAVAVGIWTAGPAGEALGLRASAGPAGRRAEPRAAALAGRFKADRVARKGAPCVADRIEADAWFDDPECARRTGVAALAAYPLAVAGRPVGVVAAFTRRPLSPAAKGTLAVISAGIAQCVGRVRAEEALRRSEAACERRARESAAALEEAGEAFAREAERRGQAEAERDRFFALSPDLLIVLGFDARIRRVSPSVVDAFGHDPGDLLSRPVLDFVHPDDRDATAELMKSLETGETVAQHECRCLAKGGAYRWVSWTSTRIFAEGVMYLVGRDITERRERLEEIGALNVRLAQSNRELQAAYDGIIEGWSRALDLRDKETEGHSRRVTEMTVRVARAMGLDGDALVHIRRGALLHDIGKMGIPDRILLKEDPLTEEEWTIMRRHPTLALEMLSPFAFLQPALEIPRDHHERWDGAGYPRGLEGEEIPLSARIFAAVDIWDALRSSRPYRRGWESRRVRDYIRSLSGTHLDPAVVDTFLRVLDEGEPDRGGAASDPAEG